MSTLTQEDIVRLSPPERLALISALWDSLSDAAKEHEIKKRLPEIERAFETIAGKRKRLEAVRQNQNQSQPSRDVEGSR